MYLYININVYICVYIHVYLQAVHMKDLGSFTDEKPQYFPSLLNHALSRRPEGVLPNFTAPSCPPASSKFLHVSEATDYLWQKDSPLT